MDIFLSILVTLLGLILIVKGADVFVDAAVWVARTAHVSELVIGATIVSIGTTLPELISGLTSVGMGMNSATSVDFNALAVGDAVGSMLCNIGLIAGLCTLIRPNKNVEKGFALKACYLLASSVLLAVFILTGSHINVIEGSILLVAFVGFLALNLLGAKDKSTIAPALVQSKPEGKWSTHIIQFVIGAVAVAGGAYMMVNGCEKICTGLGIPAQIVGITVVAIGTSLPELVTSLSAIRKGNANLGLGNIIGANTVNATLLLGSISCVSGGLSIDTFTAVAATSAMIAVTMILVVPTMITSKTSRLQGAALLAVYLGLMITNVIYIL